jgi:hypothetical protein
LPANGVGLRSHDVRTVHHVLAHAPAPIRLWFCAHGADGDRVEMVLGLVLLDKIGECELRAAHGRLFGETIGASGQTQAADALSVTHDPAASNANPMARECVLTPVKEMFRKHNADALPAVE